MLAALAKTGAEATPTLAALIDVGTVAELLNCSTRHVFRLADAGRIPAPIRLGVLKRWSRTALEEWIAGGGKAVRPVR